MEEIFTVQAQDGVIIYGRLARAPGAGPARRLIIMAHGLTGHIHQYIFRAGRDFFLGQGYDVARFSFYCDDPGARKLTGCTLAVHAADLLSVRSHFEGRYDAVFIIGNSYGGVTALLANPPASAVSLWDAPMDPYHDFWTGWIRPLPGTDYAVMGQGIERLIGPAMQREAETRVFEDNAACARAFSSPVQLVAAGGFTFKESQKRLFPHFAVTADYREIDGANHMFDEGDAAPQLFAATRGWFEKF